MTVTADNAVNPTLVRRVATAVYDAGEAARRMRSRIRMGKEGIGRKGLGNFVSEADIALSKMLCDSLSDIDPMASIVTEDGPCFLSSDETRWIVDSIDGTGNYLSDFPYSISVAYEVQGDVALGMVYEPETGRLLWAHRGGKAFVVRNLGSIMPCHMNGVEETRWIGHPITRDTESDIAIAGMPYDRGRTSDAIEVIRKMHGEFWDVKRIGPASLDICRVALGDAAIYAEYDLEPWDYSAARLVAEGTGCSFMQRDGLTVCGSPEAMRRFLG